MVCKELCKRLSPDSAELLKSTEEARVFSIGISSREDRILYMVECCDLWFELPLSRADCKQYAKLFTELAEVFYGGKE